MTSLELFAINSSKHGASLAIPRNYAEANSARRIKKMQNETVCRTSAGLWMGGLWWDHSSLKQPPVSWAVSDASTGLISSCYILLKSFQPQASNGINKHARPNSQYQPIDNGACSGSSVVNTIVNRVLCVYAIVYAGELLQKNIISVGWHLAGNLKLKRILRTCKI